ncbi:MAG: tRNA (N6-threonylcarbamoyladenosine(37)-N6)-methyltransferase TrmO [Bacteroidetes bacterium GWA2_31_9b]|nr:MAG: tRNA (N6-threonylcarbamoyladenosine(37)-N6)-methyltransferase TrmO [Bacteroidetes bacterium GWA2_31_9b]
MEVITYKPIGIIHTPFNNVEGMPIQPTGAKGVEGIIEIFPEFVDGLKDLDGLSHIILLYHLHLTGDYKLLVKPFMDDEIHGIFATRAPKRPNPIGLSVIKLNRIEGNSIYVENIDVLNNTPLIDIKPFVFDFDSVSDSNKGWLETNAHKAKSIKSDERFK